MSKPSAGGRRGAEQAPKDDRSTERERLVGTQAQGQQTNAAGGSNSNSNNSNGHGNNSNNTTAAAGQTQVATRSSERSNASSNANQEQVARSSDGPSAGPTMSNYTFFVKYTYSNECALLAYNFHEMVMQLEILKHFTYRHDPRLISVTLAYIFYRYQVHHCDMALDLAVTLVYLEDVKASMRLDIHESKDAFNLICYFAFLAHAFNADRTIRLSDWYKEIGWRSFASCQQLNGYVFFLFSKVRQFRLRVNETRVKRYIQRLCSVPTQVHGG
mmetsp:Transcript_16026/g.37800  ORF Transcript_16026/g.37800 Transcript_16026/m.37800 type:complete len:272 (+) Transcript_16026:108-923(+)